MTPVAALKMCSTCLAYYPASEESCKLDGTYLITPKWGHIQDKDNWFEICEKFNTKYCPTCGRDYQNYYEPACPIDQHRLEPYQVKEIKGPLLEQRFQLISYVGEDHLFKSYSAYDIKQDRRVLVKYLREPYRSDRKTVKRFLEQGRLALGLTHPNLIEVQAVNVTSDDAPYLVQTYVMANSLEMELKRRLYFEEKVAIKIFLDIIGALKHAHNNAVVHSHITTSHIQLTYAGDGTATGYLSDFGVAERILRNLEWDGPGSETRTTSVYGDAKGVCPEFCHGRRPSEQSDMYQLGCALWETVSGRPPFVRPNVTQTLFAHMSDEPDEISPRRVVSQELKSIMIQCLCKEPVHRFPSVDYLERKLREISGRK